MYACLLHWLTSEKDEGPVWYLAAKGGAPIRYGQVLGYGRGTGVKRITSMTFRWVLQHSLDPLHKRWREVGPGISNESDVMTHSAWAEDMCIADPKTSGLNMMLNDVRRAAEETTASSTMARRSQPHGQRTSAGHCVVVVLVEVGRPRCDVVDARPFTLGGESGSLARSPTECARDGSSLPKMELRGMRAKWSSSEDMHVAELLFIIGASLEESLFASACVFLSIQSPVQRSIAQQPQLLIRVAQTVPPSAERHGQCTAPLRSELCMVAKRWFVRYLRT